MAGGGQNNHRSGGNQIRSICHVCGGGCGSVSHPRFFHILAEMRLLRYTYITTPEGRKISCVLS